MQLREIIKNYRREHSLTLREFAQLCGTSHSYISMLEDGKNSKTGEPMTPTLTTLKKIAGALNMSLAELMSQAEDMPFGDVSGDFAKAEERFGNELVNSTSKTVGSSAWRPPKAFNPAKLKTAPGTEPNAVILEDKKIFAIGVYESISAGFGTNPEDAIIDYTPLFLSGAAEAANTICVKVQGDSMFPKIEDGDIIQLHKQDSVDSGSIAALLLDGENALVKKVVYGETWIELHSTNPMYPVMRFDGPDVLRIRVLGLVKKVIKTI